MGYEEILVEQRGRVGIITLNRPERLNAWSPVMEAEIRECASRFDADPGVGAIVFTGAGRGYCAGADVNGFASRLDDHGARERQWDTNWTQFILGLGTPTIAAVNGVAAGMGVTTILSMDVRIASEKASFGLVFVKMGVVPELGSSHLLSQLVGLGRAMEWCLTARLVPAQEALRAGLVTDVVGPDELLDRGVEIGTLIASRPSPQLRTTRMLLREHANNDDIDAVMKLESELFAQATKTAEHREAVTAFLEKRPADFTSLPTS